MGKQKQENFKLIAGIYKSSALSDPDLTSSRGGDHYNRMEEEPSGSKRKAPSCSRCSNHGEQIPLTHHKCPYEECDCLLCKLTWARKIVMRRQQQLWRQQKETQRWEEAAEGGGDNEDCEGKQKQKYCDMCRNHGVLTKNRGHKRSCPRETCMCDLCSFTRKRRHIMQLQQKVKRSNITTQQFHEATEWVTKLTEELASLGIDDVPSIPSSIPTIPTSSAFPSHRPPPQGPEGQFPSPAGLFSTSYPIEPFPNSSSTSAGSRIAPRSFLTAGHVGQYPTAPFQAEPSSPSTAGASSFPSTASVIRIPPQESSSFATLCPPSPSYTSPSASPIVDYDSPPLLSYPCPVDDTNCEMTSQSQSCSTVIRDTTSAEPLDYSTRLMRTSGTHKFSDGRHPSNAEIQDLHTNRAIHNSPLSGTQNWAGEQRPIDEIPDKYWPGQRRCSEGVLQAVYMQNQRRNSDSGIQGIYRPSQRRHSDGVIKKCYPSQRGNNDTVIQENYLPEERKDNREGFQGHYKADVRDTNDVTEEIYGPENSIQDIHHHVDQRRNSDGVISTNYRHYQRRHSDGVIRQCLNVNQRGIYDRMVQKSYMLNPPEFSDEGAHSSYSHSDRRSSDELSQGSYLVDQRRSSIDSIQENYESDERKNSNEGIRSYYWPYPRSDSGDAVQENEWPFRRRNSDEIFQGEYQLNKDHFFENTLRREHEVIECIERVIPMSISKNNSSEQRTFYKGHPASVVSIQHATVILKPTGISRDEEDIEAENNMMNWSEHSHHEETAANTENLHKENYEDMDVPIDLSVRSTTRL